MPLQLSSFFSILILLLFSFKVTSSLLCTTHCTRFFNEVQDERILAGATAFYGEFPFLVSIAIDDTHSCTGFLYSQRWVVTVASCIDKIPIGRLSAIVGQYSLVNQDVDEDVVTVRAVVINPKFDSASMRNDLALVQLSRDVTFGPNVQCIYYNQVDQTEPTTGCIAGWGARDDGTIQSITLRKDEAVPIPGDCRSYGTQFDKDLMICAGDEYHAPCEHDGGVPLIQDNTVVGLFSFNRGCGANTIASIFTNVSAHSEWLLDSAEAQPSTCIATTRPTTMATVTSEAPPSCGSISNLQQMIAEDDCLPPACTFLCPLPNGNFPIGPDACSSQYYLCVQCKPILENCPGGWIFVPSAETGSAAVGSCVPPDQAPCISNSS